MPANKCHTLIAKDCSHVVAEDNVIIYMHACMRRGCEEIPKPHLLGTPWFKSLLFFPPALADLFCFYLVVVWFCFVSFDLLLWVLLFLFLLFFFFFFLLFFFFCGGGVVVVLEGCCCCVGFLFVCLLLLFWGEELFGRLEPVSFGSPL